MGHVPHGYWQTTTFIGALRTTGLTAPLVLDGPLTTEAFRAYVTQLLCPTLHPGDLVVLDNLAVHKDPVSAQHIAQTGATLVFLPPYSPDLNPIELGLPNSKPWRGARPSGPATRSGPIWGPPWPASPRMNVSATSAIVATHNGEPR